MEKMDIINEFINELMDAAIASGNEALVEELIPSLPDVNYHTSNTGTFLMAASSYGNINIVRRLLAAGINVNTKFRGTSALFVAVREGHLPVVKLLIEAGADTTDVSQWGEGDSYDILNMAVSNGHRDIITYLLAHGIDINSQDEDGVTSLVLAIGKDNHGMVKFLLNKGADVSIRAAKDKGGGDALHSACGIGCPACVKLLCVAGADVNSIAFHNLTPLVIACRHLEMTPKVLSAGERDKLGVQYHKVIRMLLAKGADVTIESDLGNALDVAIVNGCMTCVELLCSSASVNINAKNHQGVTALMRASHHGSSEIVALLLSKGADVTPKSESGLDAIGAAMMKDHVDIVILLRKKLLEQSEVRIETAIVKYKAACISCGKTEHVKLCGGCHRARLCSVECAKAAWPQHKEDCKQWQKEKNNK